MACPKLMDVLSPNLVLSDPTGIVGKSSKLLDVRLSHVLTLWSCVF